MARRPYRHCRICGRHESVVGAMSRRGLCEEHTEERLNSSLLDMHNHTGQTFLDWRRAVAKGVGAVLIQDLPTEVRATL